MTGENSTPELESEVAETEANARRQFLKRAGQVAVTTQAVTLLLAAGGKPAVAGEPSAPKDVNSDPTLDQSQDGNDGDQKPVGQDDAPGDKDGVQ